jgi:hypothetical protein
MDGRRGAGRRKAVEPPVTGVAGIDSRSPVCSLERDWREETRPANQYTIGGYATHLCSVCSYLEPHRPEGGEDSLFVCPLSA